MNFVPEFAPDARSQWQELPPLLQELVLDELEVLLRSPPPPGKNEFTHDFVHEDEVAWHYVFLSINVDRRRGRITAAGVNYFQRPKST